MENANDIIDRAIKEHESLRNVLKKSNTIQVRASDEKEIAKSTSYAWFNNHYKNLSDILKAESFSKVNDLYKQLINYTDKATNRNKYILLLKSIRKELIELRNNNFIDTINTITNHTSDTPPDFSSLIGDIKMRYIIKNRWYECVTCIEANAPLAATVMMGGILESLLLAQFNKDTDKRKIFSAKNVPKDRKTGKPLQPKEWTLRNYLDVGHEIGWISQSTKDVGEIVRDYRNYIHPYKQASHEINLTQNDARLFWEICKEITRQILSK